LFSHVYLIIVLTRFDQIFLTATPIEEQIPIGLEIIFLAKFGRLKI
jgi:hypothetical protein